MFGPFLGIGQEFPLVDQVLIGRFAARTRARDRPNLHPPVFAANVDFRRRADEREAVQLEQEHVRRRIDGSSGAIDIDRRRVDRGGEALRPHYLNDVARRDVLLGLADVLQKLLLRHIRFEWNRRDLRRDGYRTILARTLEQRGDPLNLCHSPCVRLGRRGFVVEYSVDQDRDRLGNAIED